MGNRVQAEAEALRAAGALRAARFTTLLIDTSPRPQEQARRLAVEMDARYLPLPHAGGEVISQAVLATSRQSSSAARLP
jgi:hypothetical protein